MSLLQQMFPNRNGSKAAVEKFERDLADAMRRVNANSPRVNEPDRWSDRLVPQVFAARITASTAQTALGASWIWWEYDWVEVERNATAGTWTTVSNGRSNAKNGKAWNAWETSIGNSGGSVFPSGTTITRLAVPNSVVVDMVIDFRGRAWFSEQNPLQSVCDDTQGLLAGAGDGCDGTIVDGGYAFTDISGGSASSTDFYDMDGTHAFCNAGES